MGRHKVVEILLAQDPQEAVCGGDCVADPGQPVYQAHLPDAVTGAKLGGDELAPINVIITQLYPAGNQLVHLVGLVALAVDNFVLADFSLSGASLYLESHAIRQLTEEVVHVRDRFHYLLPLQLPMN